MRDTVTPTDESTFEVEKVVENEVDMKNSEHKNLETRTNSTDSKQRKFLQSVDPPVQGEGGEMDSATITGQINLDRNVICENISFNSAFMNFQNPRTSRIQPESKNKQQTQAQEQQRREDKL